LEVKFLRFTEISRNSHLLFQLVKRDFSIRFTGSALGVAWAVLQPLSLVLLYWFVFTFMIPRAGVTPGDGYIFFLISGLRPWLGINEGILRSTTSIVENSSMVRRLALKSELLVFVPNLTAVAFEIIALLLFALFLAARGGGAGALWLLPLALLVQLLIQIGIGLILAPLHVFFRDVIQVLGFAMSILFYLSPILYEVSGRYKKIFGWNPMTPLLGLFRSALLGAPLPQLGSIVFLLTSSIALFCVGLWFFRRAQGTLVDLI
jgi:ABC-type polysaccharide/polyol phosphate export permease